LVWKEAINIDTVQTLFGIRQLKYGDGANFEIMSDIFNVDKICTYVVSSYRDENNDSSL